MKKKTDEINVLLCWEVPGREQYLCERLTEALAQAGVKADICTDSPEKAAAMAAKKAYGALILSLQGSSEHSLRRLHSFSEKLPEMKIFVLDYYGRYRLNQEFIKAGAYRTITMPTAFGRAARIIADHLLSGDSENIPYIADFLRRYGFRDDSKGFEFLCRSVEIVLEDQASLKGIVKNVYTKVGEDMGTSYNSVDRMIRYVAENALKDGVLDRLSGTVNTERPTNQNFLRIICTALEKEYTRYTSLRPDEYKEVDLP